MAKIEVDNHKLMYHPERIAEWKKRGDCFPIYIEIGPTNMCNHRCIFCALDFLGKEKRAYIDRDLLIRNLKDMAKHGVKSVMFAGEGEPLEHKDISSFVKNAKQSGMDVSITTNGSLFNTRKQEECLPYLSWIRFSVDAGTSETYKLIHQRDDFKKTINNVENSVILRNKLDLEATIGVQFLVLPQNIREVSNLAEILSKIGADNMQIKPYSHHPNSLNDFSVKPEEYNRLEEELKEFDSENFKIILRKKTLERIQGGISYPECYGLPFFALIDSAANIIPCNLFYNNEEFIYGNLSKESFSEIWNGEKRKEVLKKLKEKGVSECRLGCRLDADNRYLHRLKNPEPHDNFI